MTLTPSPFSAASRKPPTNTGNGLHEFYLMSSPRRRGSAIISVGDLLNKSFPRCVSSLESRITSFDCSLGKHTSRSKNKRWLWFTSAADDMACSCRFDPLPQAETLVTVSPCEFPPRCLPRILPCHPRDPSCHPREGEDPLASSHCHPGSSYLSSPTWSGISRPSHCHPDPSYLSSPTWSGISPLSPHFTLSSFGIPENFI